MANSANQKLKPLGLTKYLLEYFDEEHSVSIQNMSRTLAARDINTEYKSLYGNFALLRLFVLDIVQACTKTTGCYVGSRNLEVSEFKLLHRQVDAQNRDKSRNENELKLVESKKPPLGWFFTFKMRALFAGCRRCNPP